MSDMFLALQEQKITALREQLALKYTQISGLWAENAELHAALSKSKAELDEWRFTNKIDEMQREIERLSTHVVKSQPVEQGKPVRPMSDEQIDKLRGQTFSINNPFCPVDSKSFRKAVHAAEYFHGIKGATE